MPRKLAWLAAAIASASAVLLIAGAQDPQTVQPLEGDNGECFVCHIDFDGELLVQKHIEQGITCRSCHGASDHHRKDETLMTRPDLLWGRSEVVEMCRQCHEQHQNPDKVAAFKQQWTGKTRPDNSRHIHDDPVCTDCHGEHTIPET